MDFSKKEAIEEIVSRAKSDNNFLTLFNYNFKYIFLNPYKTGPLSSTAGSIRSFVSRFFEGLFYDDFDPDYGNSKRTINGYYNYIIAFLCMVACLDKLANYLISNKRNIGNYTLVKPYTYGFGQFDGDLRLISAKDGTEITATVALPSHYDGFDVKNIFSDCTKKINIWVHPVDVSYYTGMSDKDIVDKQTAVSQISSRSNGLALALKRALDSYDIHNGNI